MKRSARFLCLLSLVFETTACSKLFSVARDSVRTPTQEQALTEVRRSAPTAAQLARQLCGLPAGGLRITRLTMQRQTLGQFTMQVEGNPLPPEEGIPDSGVQWNRALVCTGVLVVTARAVLNSNSEFDHFEWSTLEADSVTTPGVEFHREYHGKHRKHRRF